MTSVPAKPYRSGVELSHMDPGGYQFREGSYGLLWFFRTPLGGAVVQRQAKDVKFGKDDSPIVEINGWVLSGNVWRKG
jgi:hypothetical protein